MTPVTIALRLSAVLWLIWGLVHILAGVIVLSNDAAGAVDAVADAVDLSGLDVAYPDAANALINQHGFNLLWIGAATAIGSWFVWRHSVNAIFFNAIVGGVTDVGYFLFLDLGGYVNFMPGTLMTLISASAVILSFWAYFFGGLRRSTG